MNEPDCCGRPHVAHQYCYRHQCLETARLFVKESGIEASKAIVCFQSQMGPGRWLGPSTQDTLNQLRGQGLKKLLVICPSFVSDCLETLEEIALRGEDSVSQSGSTFPSYIPCLNTHPKWVDFFRKRIDNE